MTDRELLLALRAKLATPDRWTKGMAAKDFNGSPADPCGGDAISWCLVGACDEIGDLSSYRDAAYLLGFVGTSGHLDMVDWNDAPDRTHADVLARIDEALERLK